MEDQSPYVSSSNAGQPEEQPHRGAGEPQHKPWEGLDDVLDLTGGQYSHPAFNVSFPDKHQQHHEEEKDEDKQHSYSDSLEPSPEEEEPSSIGSDVPQGQVIPSAPRGHVIPSAPAEEHDKPAASHDKPAASHDKPAASHDKPASHRFHTTASAVVDLIHWRNIKKSGAAFGGSLFLLLSLTVFSIVSVAAYIALALLSVTISFRIYKGVLQAIQKSDEGHPFKQYLDTDVSVSADVVKKYCDLALVHINSTIKELRRLFLVEDLVDSLKFAVLMWVFTYIGALFNGLTLLILALITLFSIPVVYERHQPQVDHHLGVVSKKVNSLRDLVLAKVPGLKRKAE